MSLQAPRYEIEPYRRELEVAVVDVRPATSDQPASAVLDDTLIYPEGGGQPADHGWLAEAVVTGARRDDGVILHLLDRPLPTGPALLRLDWGRRFDHMQQHTAQHLLTALALETFGWATTAFHLGAEVSSIDLDTAPPSEKDLETLEAAAVEKIVAGLPVTSRRVGRDELDRLLAAGEVRSRRLPAEHRGDVRLVEIAGLDVNTCGGTHVGSLAELATVKLLAVEAAHGGCRLVWVAGDRVRRRLGVAEKRTAELRRLFETSADELPSVARLKLDQLRAAERRGRHLEERWAEALAARLTADDAPTDLHLEDVDGGMLQRVARLYGVLPGDGVLLLTAERETDRFFALAASPEFAGDLAALGREVAELLDGRGGGSGAFFQGKAGNFERRSEAVARVLAATDHRDS